MVGDWFGWDALEANLLFTAAGAANLLCAVAMSILTAPKTLADGSPSTEQRVSDRSLLLVSLVLGLVGWLVMIPPSAWGITSWDGTHSMGLPQFAVGFSLVTVCFPFGRGLCLAMVGKLLGNRPQGFWMGLTLALGAIARIAGPFWAVAGYYLFGGPFAVFGSCALFFALSVVAMRVLWVQIVPPQPPPRGGAGVGGEASPHSQGAGDKGGGPAARADGERRASYFEGFAALTSSPRLIQTPPNLTPEQSPNHVASGRLDSHNYAPPAFILPPDVISVSSTTSSPPSSSSRSAAAAARPAPSLPPVKGPEASDSPAKSLRRL